MGVRGVLRYLRWLSLVLAFVAAIPPATAMTALFYQPQLRDRSLPETKWHGLFTQARALGFDTLVLQWTRHGPAFTEGAERAWLETRVEQARAAGFALVIGLAADPAFFDRQMQVDDALAAYLRRLTVDDVALAQRWATALPASAIDGWYLPAEIDDRNWRDPARAKLLTTYLADSVGRLRAVLDRPVYASAFFTGKMHPQRYADLLGGLRATGVRLWVQDGAGTGALTPAERTLYLDLLQPCGRGPVDAIVNEIFVQVSGEGSFRAVAADPATVQRLLDAPPPCGDRRVFFDMRYLPGLAAAMGTPRAQNAGPTGDPTSSDQTTQTGEAR